MTGHVILSVANDLLFTTLLFMGACINLENPAPPNQSQLVVHAVLDPRTDQQIVLIARSRSGMETAAADGATNDEPVSGADVTITAPNGTVMRATAPAGTPPAATPGNYFYSPAQSGVTLAGGETYTLHIRTPTGEEVIGTTTMPFIPFGGSTTLPPPTFNRLTDTLRLRWSSAVGAASYEVVLRSRVAGEYRIFRDTTVSVPGTTLTLNGDPVFPSTRRVTLLVSAVDDNYYEYYRAQSDPFAGTAPSHLHGAVGVFGSITPILGTSIQVR
jgi:hypothetical protein